MCCIFEYMIEQLKDKYATPELAGKAINTLARISSSKAGKLALDIFCSPREGKELSKKEKRFLDRAENTDLAFEDYTVRVYRWGTGSRKLFLAHGYESNSARWRALVPLLVRNDYEVVAMDAPAHGQSGSKMLNGVQYANALKLVIEKEKPFAVIGHSLGAMSTAWYFKDLDNIPISKFITLAIPSKLRTAINLFYEILGMNANAIKAMETHFNKKFGFTIDDFTVAKFFKDCDVNGTMIHDKSDTVVSIEEALSIHQVWNNSFLIETNGLGHFLQSGDVFRMILEELDKSSKI